MQRGDARIQTALLSINPTTQRPAWHGAPTVIGLLRGVTSSMAVWRPSRSMNNIREISLHVAFWENSVANRLSGESVRVGFSQRKTGSPKRLDVIDAADWKAEVKFVAATHHRLIRIVTDFDPARLDRPIDSNTNRVAIEFIHGIAEHGLYHAAQIKMIRLLAKRAGA